MVEERLSGLGDVLGGANRPAVTHGSEEEEDLGVVVTELLAAPGLVQRTRGSRRFLWTHRGGTGWTVAVVNCVGDDELRSGVLGRGSRGRGGEQRVRERSEGPRGVSVASLEGPGRKQEVARAASARSSELLRALARGRRRPCPWWAS